MRHILTLTVISLFFLKSATTLAEEKIELPPFQPATVEVDGDPVRILYRSFDPGFSLGDMTPENLPQCATRTVVQAEQALAKGDRNVFLESAVDREQAARFAEHVERMSADKRKAWSEKVLGREVVGELKVEETILVIADRRDGEDLDRKIYFVTLDDGQAMMIAVPYYLLEEVSGLKIGSGAIAKQLKTQKLSLF